MRSANAATVDVTWGHKTEGETAQQTVNAKYSLRMGLHGLGSDYSYSRHVVSLRYEVRSGRQTATDELTGRRHAAAMLLYLSDSCWAAVRPCAGGTGTRSTRWGEPGWFTIL